MRLTRYRKIEAFAQRAEPFLVAQEAVHCLQLGLCNTLRRQPVGDSPPYLATVERDDRSVAAVILRTPPHHVTLSLMNEGERDTALALAADDLGATYGELPGAVGSAEIVAAFAARWRVCTGQSFRIATHERIYQLERVMPMSGVPGRLRRAGSADLPVLIRWLDAFDAEALTGGISRPAEQYASHMLADVQQGVYFWDNGTPVSLACYKAPTPHGMRIGPVYTPPDQRGHGYASACVATLSQLLLDEGRRFVFLFTDLANSTSNHIYQTIGYQPVADMDEYRFETSR